MVQQYRDTWGNLIKEGFYLENRDISQIRFVSLNKDGVWRAETPEGKISLLCSGEFRNYGVLVNEEVEELQETFSRKAAFLKNKLEQLAEKTQTPVLQNSKIAQSFYSNPPQSPK